jgi:hypothetical protein
VAGLLNVLRGCEARGWPLRHLVVFSSLAGFHGNAAQTDYSMANEAIAKAAHALARRDPALSSVAFCFGPWDGGMVDARLKAHFQSQGVQIIPRDGGAAQVAALLDPSSSGSSNAPQHRQYLVGNWGFPAVQPDPATFPVGVGGGRATATASLSVRRTLHARSNPFLASHVIRGARVLPMTCAVGQLGATVADLFPGWVLSAVRDFGLFRGVSFSGAAPGDDDDDDAAVETEAQVTLNSVSADRITATTVLRTRRSASPRSSGSSSASWQPAYKASVELVPAATATAATARRLLLDEPTAAFVAGTRGLLQSPASLTDLYDGRTLFHGPMFQGILGVTRVDESGLVAACVELSLAHSAQGQFRSSGIGSGQRVDPFAADVTLQGVLVWARVAKGKAALPTAGGSFVFHRAVPRGSRYFLHVAVTRSDGASAAATCTAHDGAGSVYFVGTDLVVTLTDSNDVYGAVRPPARQQQGELPPAGGSGGGGAGKSGSSTGNSSSDAAKATTGTTAQQQRQQQQQQHTRSHTTTSAHAPLANARYADAGGVVDGQDRRIAVVGMAVEYGGAKDKEQLWDAVLRKNIASGECVASPSLSSSLDERDRSCIELSE